MSHRIIEAMGHRFGGVISETCFLKSNFKKNNSNKNLLESEFDPTKKNFYIYGPTGTGKTHFATAVMMENQGRVIRLSSISRAARIAAKEKEIDEGDFIGLFVGKKISTYEIFIPPISVFCLDDLGSEKLTEFSESILFEIIDGRIMNGINGMIVTSNLSLDDLSKKIGSDRIASRLAGLCDVFDLSEEKDHRIDRNEKKEH